MKLLKVLTTITLVFALFTLQVQHSNIVLSDAMAQSTGEVNRNSERQKHSFTANHIMLWTSLAAAPSWVVACPSNASVLLFAAGAAALLAGEIITFAKFKDLSTSAVDMIAKYDKETANDQIELLEAAGDQEQRAADALGKKKTYTTIAASAYTAAAVLAFAESLNIMKAAKPCVPIANNIQEQDATQSIYAHHVKDLYSPYVDNHEISAHLAQVEDYRRFYNGELRSLSVDEYRNNYEPLKNSVKKEDNKRLISAFKMASDLFSLIVPSAHAEGGKKVGGSLGSAISAAVVSTILTLITPVRAALSQVFAHAWTRGIAFTVFAGGAWGAMAELSAGQKRLEDNAQIYRELAASLRSELEGRYNVKGPKVGRPNNQLPRGPGRDNNLPPEVTDGAICLVGNLGEQRVDPQCQCRQNNSCAKVDLRNFGLGGSGLPSSFANGLGTFGSGINSFLSGNTAGANTAANAFGHNAARDLKNLLKAVKGKASEKAAKEGKPIDFEKAEKALGKKILNDMNRAIAGMTPQQLAGMNTSATGALADKIAEKVPESKQALASIQAPTPASAKDSGMDFSFDFGEEETPAQVAAEDINYEDALDGYVTNQNDISDRRNENIFNIITVRYFKSAYPRFFEEQKASLE